jgi:predicted outer membrane repeat protein
MEFFAAIHVPEIFGSRPAFIGDFGLPSKNASNRSAAVVEAAPSIVFRQSRSRDGGAIAARALA